MERNGGLLIAALQYSRMPAEKQRGFQKQFGVFNLSQMPSTRISFPPLQNFLQLITQMICKKSFLFVGRFLSVAYGNIWNTQIKIHSH